MFIFGFLKVKIVFKVFQADAFSNSARWLKACYSSLCTREYILDLWKPSFKKRFFFKWEHLPTYDETKAHLMDEDKK